MFFKRKMNKQRKEKGYCDQDLYDISNWFLTIVPNMLTEFNENRHGYPGNLTDREWTKIVNQIIYYLEKQMKILVLEKMKLMKLQTSIWILNFLNIYWDLEVFQQRMYLLKTAMNGTKKMKEVGISSEFVNLIDIENISN